MTHSHTHTSAQHTEGMLIHWATAYDVLIQVASETGIFGLIAFFL